VVGSAQVVFHNVSDVIRRKAFPLRTFGADHGAGRKIGAHRVGYAEDTGLTDAGQSEDELLDLLGIDLEVVELEDIGVTGLDVQIPLAVKVTDVSRAKPHAVGAEGSSSGLRVSVVACPLEPQTGVDDAHFIDAKWHLQFVQHPQLNIPHNLALATHWSTHVFAQSAHLGQPIAHNKSLVTNQLVHPATHRLAHFRSSSNQNPYGLELGLQFHHITVMLG